MVRKTEQPKDQVHWGRIEHASEEAYRRKTLRARRRWLEERVERMRQQRVPLVLINVVTEPEVRGFSIVYQYIQDNYREAWRGNFGNGPDYKVFVKRDLPTRGTYPPFDLPCYR